MNIDASHKLLPPPRRDFRSVALAASLLFASMTVAQTASAEDPFALWHGRYRFSYELVTLPAHETMGLAGVHYLVDVSPKLYGGVGFFGAVSGNRGGFFTGGVDAGFRQPVADGLFLDGGLFLGGGGGSGAPQGGGLMVRAHAGVLYAFPRAQAGLAWSLVDLPNGEIRSSQAVAFLDLPFDELRLTDERDVDLARILTQASSATGREIVFSTTHFAPFFQVYRPDRGSVKTDRMTRADEMRLLGFEYGHGLGHGFYIYTQAAGAADGASDGYAEVFFGAGYRLPLLGNRQAPGSILFDGRAAAGAGGGGRVDTGNGTMTKAVLGLIVTTSAETALAVHAGIVDSAGSFRARTLDLGFLFAMDAASFGKRGRTENIENEDLRLSVWRTRLACQQYLDVNVSMRKSQRSGNLSLVGVKIDRILRDSPLYLTGQALSAYAGGAGGYSAGLMGVGYLSEYFANTGMKVFFEALFGEGGGGGIAVGGGAVAQPTAGVVYELGRNIDLEAGVGRIMALHGPLDSTSLDVGITYRFATIGRRAAGF